MPQPRVVVALTTTQVSTAKGVPVTVRTGQFWPANDEIVQTYPSLFTEDFSGFLTASGPWTTAEPDGVEQATRGPGEKRNIIRRNHPQA